MKAYIILAHKYPMQVYRLVERLDDDKAFFFIHIDKKADLDSFHILNEFGNKIVFVERADARWGQWGIVKGTINALTAIKQSNIQFDYIHLLSGQDYPIKSNSEIDEFFKSSPYKIFMTTYGALPVERWENGGLHRVNYYYFGPEKAQKFLAKCLHFLMLFIHPLKKKKPYDLIMYGGSQWWTIDMYALNFLLDYIDNHPKLISYFKYSFAPDELFFQTIFNNAKDENILKSICNNNLRFIDFPAGQPNPKTLGKKDFNNIMQSDKLFARKFDLSQDAEIVNMIGEGIKEQKPLSQ